MNIAFDAKRVYNNHTGLGNYSRSLIKALADYFPENYYYLYTPATSNLFKTSECKNIETVTPQTFPGNIFRSAWRSSWVKKDLIKNHIDLYHGLSHEIPMGIKHTGIKTAVTIHDLIFERYPEQYNSIDVKIYRKKFMNACKNADAVIAISQQTKNDIIHFYKIPAEKIHVCYQSCNPAFAISCSKQVKDEIKEKYKLPEKFFLYTGSVIERKNLLNICKAMLILQSSLNVPLIVIGEGSSYKNKVLQYLKENGLERQVVFLNDQPFIKATGGYVPANHLPAIYQLATCMVYPSFFEGFGIPVLEALWSRLPVITSNTSCLPEAGGNAALYVNPSNEKEIADAMLQCATGETLRNSMISEGLKHAEKFTENKAASSVMAVYKQLF